MQDFIVYLRNRIWYAACMALLALLSAGMLAYTFFAKEADEQTLQIMLKIDLGIAYIFLADFVLAFSFAQKKRAFLKENWIDVLGAIPLSEGIFRAMRILRTLRLIRLVKVANTGRSVQDTVQRLKKRYEKQK